MPSWIFNHSHQRSGDRLTVTALDGDELSFGARDGADGESAYVILPRAQVLKLHSVLDAWLCDTEEPARVMPLDEFARSVEEATAAIRRLIEAAQPAADPEPRDVGHPTYEDARTADIGACMLSEPLMRPLSEPCGECGHPWGLHPEVQRKIGLGLRTPSDPGHRPVPACTCHDNQGNSVMPSAPECGRCGAPWNDGHGQPGDPCIRTCDECTHPADRHGKGGCGWVVRDDHGIYCRCTWEPGTAVPAPRSAR